MKNINLSQENYVDYVGNYAFNAMNVKNMEYTPKVVEVDGKKVVLIHVSGVQVSSGVLVNTDLWPRYDATEEDIKNLPEQITDIVFRVGYHPEIDADGNTVLREGAPKWIAYYNGTTKKTLSGEKREFTKK